MTRMIEVNRRAKIEASLFVAGLISFFVGFGLFSKDYEPVGIMLMMAAVMIWGVTGLSMVLLPTSSDDQ